LLILASVSVAHAEPRTGDKTTAEALFAEGRKLMAAGKFAEACPKLEASLKLDTGVGTMLNLADCYEKNGQTASAWSQFREAASAARDAGSKDRADLARSRATALEPKLSHLTITVSKNQVVDVTRDGAPLDSATFGTPVPVDPGKHVIAASATGKRKWTTSVDVTPSAQVSVEVPVLADEAAAASASHTTTASGPEKPAATSGSSQRTFAIAAGVIGLAGIGAGSVFGLKASSTWSDAKGKCTSFPSDCGQEGKSLSQDAQSSANLATIGFVVGGAGIAAAAVLWFTAPSSTEGDAKVAVGVEPGRVLVSGRF
jgi:hypothetical protein